MLRLAVPADAARLAAVHVRSWQSAYVGLLPQEFLDSLDAGRRAHWWRQALDEGRTVHVVDVDGIVGFCHADASEADADWGEVYSIYVLADHWGEGHGRALINAGLEQLRQQGFDRALLWVLQGNSRARTFYESNGWRLARPFRVESIGGTQVNEVSYEIEL